MAQMPATFILICLVTILEKLLQNSPDNSFFYQAGSYFRPHYIVESTMKIFVNLSIASLRIEKSLSLSLGCKTSFEGLLKKRLKITCEKCFNTCGDYVTI